MAVYLDYNASSPVDERVLERMIEVYRSHYGNADSRTHIFGTEAKEIVSTSRKTIADILGVDSTDLFFTSGSTESNNMAILGLLDYALESGRNHFITTTIEHKSVLEAMKHLQSKGCDVDFVSPDSSGRIKPEQILDLVTDKTLLVSMMHVNSETGIIQPIEEVGAALAKTKTYFHIDATQGFGKLNQSLRNTKYNMLSITAHKLGGPQGIGAFVLRRDRTFRRPPVKQLMYGGQQERGYRPGTTPVALVAGFALAAYRLGIGNAITGGKHGARAVLGIRLQPQTQNRLITLGVANQILCRLRRSADQHHQNTACHGVKCARMTHLTCAEKPSYYSNRIEGGNSLRLIDKNYSVLHLSPSER